MYKVENKLSLTYKCNYFSELRVTLGLPFWKILPLFAHFLPPLLCQHSYLKVEDQYLFDFYLNICILIGFSC